MPALRLTPGAHRLLVRTLADGADLADTEPRTAVEVRELTSTLQGHARDCGELLAIVARRKPPKKALPEPRRKDARQARYRQGQAEMAALRAAVMARADGQCEACGIHDQPWNPLILHHRQGGVGRRRQKQTVENCSAICATCHRRAHGERIAEAR